MAQQRKRPTSKWMLATRILAERRAILDRLTALDRRSPARDRGRLGGDNTPTSEVIEAAQESAATELEFVSREILVGRLKALARAEAKIREDTYGRCDGCGQPIGAARLQVLPEAVRCIPCANQREQRLPSSQQAAARA